MRISLWAALAAGLASLPCLGQEPVRVAFALDATRLPVAREAAAVLGPGGILHRDDRLATGTGPLQFDLPGGTSVSMGPNSRLTLGGSGRGLELDLEAGRLRVARGHGPASAASGLRVVAGAASVTLVHADASISVDGGLELFVGRGQARLCVRDRCRQVVSGQSARLNGGEISVAPAIPDRFRRSHYNAEADAYAQGEQRTAAGQLLGVGRPRLADGAGYAVAYTFLQGVGVGADALAPVTAGYDALGAMTRMSGGGSSLVAQGAITGQSDGVVGWGRWAAPIDVNQGGATVPGAQSLAYVAGMPTPSPSLSALTGVQASFAMIGQTTPVSSTGMSGGPVSGTFDVLFGAPTVITATLRVPINGAVFNLGGSTATNSTLFNGQMFIGCSPCGSGAGGGLGAFYGLFAGPVASRAAYSYIFESRSPALGNITGAVAFGR